MSLACLPDVEAHFAKRGWRVHPYQVKAAERLLEEMGGHGILADEVGLGKTIEAGLLIRELRARGENGRVLVLVPASLMYQWQRELLDKFGLATDTDPASRAAVVVTSLDLAKREARRNPLLAEEWGLLLVDEAHRLKNRKTQNHQLVAALRCRHLVLISATPLQNDLRELHALVSLVRPDLLGSAQAFQRQYLMDKRTPKDPADLRRQLERVMVRHRRGDLDFVFPRRQVELFPLELTPLERTLYEAVTEVVRAEYWARSGGRGGSMLPLLTLQREACSSAAALRASLAHMEGGEWRRRYGRLWEMARAVDNQAKSAALEAVVRELGEKVIVYTEYRATQDDLVRRLRRAGLKVVAFHGGLTPGVKDDAIQAFARKAQVMVSTQCGGEGLNLQFCSHLVNFDLPWNPMRVEQRIGRVHRIGQASEVHVYNLYARHTVEEHILRLLDEKINLFRQVIGELDEILQQLERKRSFERTLLHIALTSEDEGEMEHRFDQLGNQMAALARRVRPAGGEPAST